MLRNRTHALHLSVGLGALQTTDKTRLECNTGESESASSDTDDHDRWDPAAHVTYNDRNDSYEIDADFLYALTSAGFQQLGNDRARVEPTTSGYYKLVDVAAGDLVAELGMRSGDILKSINGHDLGTMEQQIDAYAELKNEADFLLTIDRSGVGIQFSYVIVN